MADDNTILNRLIVHIGNACAADSSLLGPTTLLDHVGIDSLSLTQIVAAVEAELGIELGDEDVGALLEARTVGDYLAIFEAAAKRAEVL